MRLTMTMFTLCVLSVLMLANTPAVAGTLIFTHTGSGSGTLNGVPFGTSDFSLTASVDTSFREPHENGWFIDHATASISIDGLGNLNILTATRTFVNHPRSIVGFSRGGDEGWDLFHGPGDPVFSVWDMLTPIGPISEQGELIQWTSTPQIETSGGVLIFDYSTSSATFQALPEPAMLLLMGAALPVLLKRRRSRS